MKCPQCDCPLAKVERQVTKQKPYVYELRCLECDLDFQAYQCIKCGTMSFKKVCGGCVRLREQRMIENRRKRLCLKK